jgi:hypothetical protein
VRRADRSETAEAQITGHKTSSKFRQYNITNEDNLKKAVELAQEYMKSLPTERQNVVPFSKKDGSKEQLSD